MQLIADYFPLILFFLAFKWQGIMVATAVAIAASVVQIAWFKWKGKVSPIHWISLVIIAVFGGATLILQDEVFIKWKPTVLYGAFCAVLAVGKLAFGRDLIAYLLKDIELPAAIWTRVTWSWAALLRGDGGAQLVRGLPFPDRDMGELQGLGRHRAILRVRARARPAARPLHHRAAEAMTRVASTLKDRLAPLAPLVFELADDSAEHVGHAGAADGGGHFSLLIVSEQFAGLTRLARHRAVLDRVGD